MIKIEYTNEQKENLKEELLFISNVSKFLTYSTFFLILLLVIPIYLLIEKISTINVIFTIFLSFAILLSITFSVMLNIFVSTIKKGEYSIYRTKCKEYCESREGDNNLLFEIKTENNENYIMLTANSEIDYIDKEIDVILGDKIKYVRFVIPAKKDAIIKNEEINDEIHQEIKENDSEKDIND